MRDLLRTMPQAHLAGRDEAVRVGALIGALAKEPRGGHRSEANNALGAYTRREMARRFAAVLDAACAKSPSV